MPFALAALQASSVSAAALSESAGVMPVQWNHDAFSKIASQSNSDTAALAMAEPARS